MSAEILRDAAELIRAEHGNCGCGQDDCPASDAPFHLAVADWLDFQAEVERRLGGPDYETPASHPALTVARAYLGGE